MIKYLSSTSNRFKALYLIWVFIHFVLFLLSGSLSRSRSFDSAFYPFYFGRLEFKLNVYDYSEFILYSFTPIVLFIVYHLWRKDRNTSTQAKSDSNTLTNSVTSTEYHKNVLSDHQIKTIPLDQNQNVIKHNKAYLTPDKAIKLRLSYFFYLVIWSIIITQFSYEHSVGMVFEVFGFLVGAWLIALIIGLYRIIRKVKPTISLYIFHFIWATVMALYALYFQIKVAEYINK